MPSTSILPAPRSALALVLGLVCAARAAYAPACSSCRAQQAPRSRSVVAAASTITISNPGSMTQGERMASRYGGWAFEPEGGWDDMDTGFSYEDMAASIGEITTYSRGDTCKGTVMAFEPAGAMVDIGVKSAAFCSLQEMALVKPDRPEYVLDLDAEYEFVIVSREDENGQLMLSRRRILHQAAWEKVAELMGDDAIVEAEVVAVNRGGAMMQVEGLRAFLPGSHFLAGQNPTEDFVGKKLEVKFLDVDKVANRLVVSHRKAVVDTQIKDLSVGSVLKGIVTAVKPYGAFIDIGGMSGLLHISQISTEHVSNVEAILPVGAEVKTMVISQDKGKGRVALSTKTLESEAGEMIKDPAKVFANAEDTAAKYQERIVAERKAREEAAQEVIFGLESVFSETAAAAPAEEGAAAEGEAAPEAPAEALSFEE